MIGPKLPTIAQAKQMLRNMNITLRQHYGQFRICKRGAPEVTAYYADDILDAVRTAEMMSKEK